MARMQRLTVALLLAPIFFCSVQGFVGSPRLSSRQIGHQHEQARVGVTGTALYAATAEQQLTAGKNPRGNLYQKQKEQVGALDGLKIGLRKLVVITGASSGLGLQTTRSIAEKGGYFIVCAVRDPEKMKRVAASVGIKESDYIAMKLELGSLESVRDFVANLRAFKTIRPLDHLICNGAVYLPADPNPSFTDDGFEMSVGVNHLGHYLLARLLIDDLKRAKGARCVIVGSITGNTNTIGGGLVWPRADLGKLQGLSSADEAVMADGGNFDGAKAYKDSKVMNMMTMSELHRRYHDETGITFTSMYPGCIAETALFREKREWFRKLFPVFMKYVTGGYVGEVEAGDRLAQCIDDPQCSKSGVYWSWNGNAKQVATVKIQEDGEYALGGSGGAGGEIFENELSNAAGDRETAEKVWMLSERAVGL